MLGNIGPGMLILIVIAALLLFGPSKLPELGRAFGKTLREFKNGAKDMMNDDEQKDEKSTIEVVKQERKEIGPEAEKKDDSRRLPD